jgi:hypothetical protein
VIALSAHDRHCQTWCKIKATRRGWKNESKIHTAMWRSLKQFKRTSNDYKLFIKTTASYVRKKVIWEVL